MISPKISRQGDRGGTYEGRTQETDGGADRPAPEHHHGGALRPLRRQHEYGPGGCGLSGGIRLRGEDLRRCPGPGEEAGPPLQQPGQGEHGAQAGHRPGGGNADPGRRPAVPGQRHHDDAPAGLPEPGEAGDGGDGEPACDQPGGGPGGCEADRAPRDPGPADQLPDGSGDPGIFVPVPVHQGLHGRDGRVRGRAAERVHLSGVSGQADGPGPEPGEDPPGRRLQIPGHRPHGLRQHGGHDRPGHGR